MYKKHIIKLKYVNITHVPKFAIVGMLPYGFNLLAYIYTVITY